MVDIQYDFCAGGSLAVPDGDAIVPLANALQAQFDVVIATQDWHPADHMSFAANQATGNIGDVIEINGMQQVLWPVHCVQGSRGAEFHPELDVTRVNKIVHKGADKTIDSYSAFFDNAHLRSTGLADYLREQDVNEIYIIGLATDYCVKYSCLDAVRLGLKTHVIMDACRGIDLQWGDVDKAVAEMREVGVEVVERR
jgi:nicotinamidase/pyrazinamidase